MFPYLLSFSFFAGSFFGLDSQAADEESSDINSAAAARTGGVVALLIV